MSWPNNRSEFGENRTPVLIGVSSADGVTIVPVAVDHATGAVLTETSGGGGTDDVNLTEVGGSAIALGQTTMSASLPVVIASNQSAIPISSGSATGAAVPADAFYIGAHGPSGNLVGLQTTSVANASFDTGTLAAGMMVNGTTDFKNYVLAGNNAADGMSTGISAFVWSQGAVYNGSTWDRVRSSTSIAGTAGTGLLGSGTMIYDGTNWQSTKDGTGRGDGDTTGYMGVQPRLYNGSTYDRARSTTTGVQAVGINNGTNTADVVSGDSGFNGVATAGAAKTYTFTTSSSGAQVLLANTNCEGFSSARLTITSVGVGLGLQPQFASASGGTYISLSTSLIYNTQNDSAVLTQGYTVNNSYVFPIVNNFVQINISALTSGTLTGVLTLTNEQLPAGLLTTSTIYSGGQNVGNATLTGFRNSGGQFNLALDASNGADANGGGGVGQNTLYGYNGSTYDRLRTANSAAGTTGTGLLGAGLLEWDGTNYQRVPAARFSPASTKLNTNSYHITTNTTNTPTASTAYISSIAISAEVGGTTSSITIQDKQGTPLKLVNGLSTTAVTTAPTIISFQTPVLMTSGIDIITSGAVAGTVDVWINWYQ
jgi:hypothetical protein